MRINEEEIYKIRNKVIKSKDEETILNTIEYLDNIKNKTKNIKIRKLLLNIIGDLENEVLYIGMAKTLINNHF